VVTDSARSHTVDDGAVNKRNYDTEKGFDKAEETHREQASISRVRLQIVDS